MANWHDDFKPSFLTDRIERLKSVSSNGTVSFPGFTHTEHSSVLGSMLRLNREIPDNEARKIINLACFAVAGAGKVTPDTLCAHVDALEKKYLSTPKAEFRLVTSVSAAFVAGPVAFQVRNTTISFGRRPSRNAGRSHAEKVNEAEYLLHGELPQSYSPVLARVSARNEHEAAKQALHEIDLTRAIWNFWINRTVITRSTIGNRAPINSIILGPIHTLHTLSGELASDSYWYEPVYRGPVSVWRDATRHSKIQEFTKKVRVALRKVPYQSSIEALLVRYVRALDSSDWHACFLELWSILEELTNTKREDTHKVTVRRSAFLSEDFAYATQVLNHLRSYRNAAVHSGNERDNVEPIMYQAKNFVEALLQFNLASAGQFKSLDDVAKFLDGPSELAEIDRQIGRLKTVRKFIASKQLIGTKRKGD